jgi:3-hydroxyacyl-CoA dehydrogenase
MNTLGSEVIDGLNKSFDLAEQNFRGLVIGNQGANFSAGANLGLVFMYAMEQEFDEIDFMIRHFQNSVMRVRYSGIPVVVAPHGLSLGGGCEITLHADAVQAAAETYTGLVEVGVGLIPGGGGTKEMARRVSQSFQAGDPELNRLQNTFMNIATAKVSESAMQAFEMGILRKGDRISMNKRLQIHDAKNLAIALAENGYCQPVRTKDIRVEGKSGMATIQAGIHAMHLAGKISDHDKKVVEKLNFVINGGDLSYPQNVSEQYLLDLEREAFLSLTGERKTLERIQGLLTGGKIVRN